MESKEIANNKYQISFLPWAGLNKEIRIGPVTFWPFNSYTRDRILDKEVLDQLIRYFQCYVDPSGEPVRTIVICSHGNTDFRCFTEKELTDLRKAVDVLIFSTIASQVKYYFLCKKNGIIIPLPPSADVFQLISQNFQLGNNDIAIRSETALTSIINNPWEIGKISFSRPLSARGSLKVIDAELIGGFNKVFDLSHNQNIRERLFRSLEWFRLTHSGSDEVSSFSRIVMMTTAFEILLRISADDKRWGNKKAERFAEEIEKRILYVKLIKESRQIRGKNPGYSKPAWWMWDFYNLRNSIVHGDLVKPEKLYYPIADKSSLSYLIIADLVFWECIERELVNLKYIGNSDESLKNLFSAFYDIHRALDWKES